MKHLIKKILKEEISDKVITKVLSQLDRGKIKPPYFKNLDLIGLSPEEIKVVMEKFTNGKVNKKLEWIKDSRGNEIYREDSYGYWRKREYDERDNNIYYEDSDGGWRKREYDERGKLIYFEDSDGNWYKKEYDQRGNLIYREDSDGNIEDNRNPQ